MARRHANITKLKIIQTALHLFLENGFSNTSARALCNELDISLGNLTFYYPSKEHLLAVLVEMLCDFQWKMMKEEADDGISLVLAVCLELMSMASASEENETARDIFISAYTSPITLEIIRKNDLQRAKMVFSEYCPEFTGFSGGIKPHDERIKYFFDNDYEYITFDNPLCFDREKFINRCLSGSYSLKNGDNNFNSYINAINKVFDEFESDGIVRIENQTVSYIGTLI